MVTKLLHHATIFRERPSKSKTTPVVKYIYISASAGVTSKVYSGLRTSTGRGFTRSWDKYEGRP